MPSPERRSPAPPPASIHDNRLTSPQRAALQDLRQFGWELAFIRHPPFELPQAFVFDRARKAIAVIEPDGHLEPGPALHLRR